MHLECWFQEHWSQWRQIKSQAQRARKVLPGCTSFAVAVVWSPVGQIQDSVFIKGKSLV